MDEFEIIIHDDWIVPSKGYKMPFDNEHACGLINDYENGEWRYKKFIKFILDNMELTALSAEEREALSSNSYTKICKAAARLQSFFDKDGKLDIRGGEIGEIVLYSIMQKYYNALPVVAKIFNKQNNNVPAYGADSVHIVLDSPEVTDNTDFSIWLGESKFFSDINEGYKSSINSLSKHLKRDNISYENSIIVADGNFKYYIQNTNVLEKIKKFLNLEINSIDRYMKKLHVPILILFESDLIKNNEEQMEIFADTAKNKLVNCAKTYFEKLRGDLRNKINQFESINFHLILFPVAEKSLIIEKMARAVSGLDIN